MLNSLLIVEFHYSYFQPTTFSSIEGTVENVFKHGHRNNEALENIAVSGLAQIVALS